MDEKKTLLIIDDDAVNRMILADIFSQSFCILEAENGMDGLSILRGTNRPVSAILLDYMMPVMDGLEVLSSLCSSGEIANIPVFLITAEADLEVTRKAYDMGVIDVISKPVIPFIVQRRISSVIELYESRKRLSLTVDEQRERIFAQNERIIRLSYGMTEALTTAIEFRSGESGAHVRRIHDIMLCMLKETDLAEDISDEEKEQIAMAAIMHDVGKIAISDAILNKPGRLTPEEFEIMKTHTTQGADLLMRIPQFRELEAFRYAYDIALHHHERWDGRGYPEHLEGDEISIYAQIAGLADVYDALQSRRCYKEAYSADTAVQMIRDGQCGAFSPLLIDRFVKTEPLLREKLKGLL